MRSFIFSVRSMSVFSMLNSKLATGVKQTELKPNVLLLLLLRSFTCDCALSAAVLLAAVFASACKQQ
jgi:hypothetical protein